MKKIFIRSKGDQINGWGNVIRQFTIAKHLSKKNFKIFFFVEAESNLFKLLRSPKIQIYRLKKNIKIKKEKKILNECGKCDFAIIEMLNPSLALQRLYKDKSKKIIVYDDLLEGKYISDFLISCQEIKLSKEKKLNKTLKFLKGYDYFPIAKYKVKIKKEKIKKRFERLNVLLGGSTYQNLYIKISKALKNFSNLRVKMIINKKNFMMNKKKILKENKSIKVLEPKKNVFKFLSEANYLIVGGGYTKIEAAFLNKPCLVICTHSHQIKISKIFCKKFGSRYLGYNREISSKNIQRGVNYLMNKKLKKEMVNKLQNFKPDGLEKIRDILKN